MPSAGSKKRSTWSLGRNNGRGPPCNTLSVSTKRSSLFAINRRANESSKAGCACRFTTGWKIGRLRGPQLMRPERGIVVFGILAGLLAAAMAVLAFRTGVTQEFFEAIHPAQKYADTLRDQATALRIAFSLDNLFLLAYSAFFLWFVIERRGKSDPLAGNVLIGSLLFASLL